ncbi:MAG: TonB-dependent receptor plug domain-containing protein, partial [Gemmatimonadetes bacterium]|nr:TonB-dependent receptor plug domain-containing protein [Gemmatimonadota bacterium]
MFQRVRFLTLALTAAITVAAPVSGQNTGVIQGHITSRFAGQPVGGVEVILVQSGQTVTALSDENGLYRLTGIAPGEYTLSTQRIGFARTSQTVVVGLGAQVTLDIRLEEQAMELDPLVVTGQGAAISRRRLSTTIDVITSETIAASPATRLEQLLQATLPSVQIRLSSGQPGATSVTRGRGPVSVSSSTTPVIYVDGIRVDNLNSMAELSLNVSGNRRQGTQTSSIADIPLENIERIEYVPGGAATTLYGSDAANGVIQIFTKKGTPGPTRLTVESEIGYESPVEKAFFFPQTSDLLYQNGLTQQYRVSGDGGNETMTWSFSGSLQDREGYR